MDKRSYERVKASIKAKPWKWSGGVFLVIAGKLFEHRALEWANHRVDDGVTIMMPQVRDILTAAIAHPWSAVFVLLASYSIVIVAIAHISAWRGRGEEQCVEKRRHQTERVVPQRSQRDDGSPAPQQAQSGDIDGVFARPFPWNDHTFYRCSVCEFDSQDLSAVEEHTKHNHGFAVGEHSVPGTLNLKIANVSSGSPLTGCRLLVTDLNQWNRTLGQFHAVREMRDFRPLGLYGDHSEIYAGKPGVFQFIDASNPLAPIIHGADAINFTIPGTGIWKASFELQWNGRSAVPFHKCIEWNGRSSPAFIVCP